MGIFAWLKARLFGNSMTRDLSRMRGSEAGLTKEQIETGGPLRPHHRRIALRDKRLLPKKRNESFSWPRSRKKVMSAAEASRLFSDTMRTRDRNLRDLLTDEQQLQRYQLPMWRSEEDIAAALELSVTQLRHFSIHRDRETSPHYVTFAIAKRSGGQRLIHAPKQKLKAIQRRLNELLVAKLPVSDHAHGFRAGRSVASNARPHVDKAVVIKLDLADCFPSIHFGRVRGLLISYGYSFPVATTLAVLMTEAPRQRVEAEGKVYHVPVGPRVCVQGAPTSPGLCNAMLLRLDRRIAGLAHKHGFGYTRYADDLTLSGDDASKVKLLLNIAEKIVRDENFQLNSRKTRILQRGGRQQVTGVTVNQQLGLSRTERRKLRAAIHQLQASDREKRQQIQGKVAYLSMLNPEQAAPLKRALERNSNTD